MNELIVFEFTKDRELFELVKTVSTRLNTPAYVVGGYVRDLIMGNESKDIDITLVGNSKIFCEELKKEMKAKGDEVKLSVYETYGTVSLSSKLFGEVEFVTARNESYSRESRNPECTPGTLHEDLRRRDFTINAMAISLNKQTFGELVDMFDGYGDIKRGIIKTPIEPDSTFIDDPLRMLRAIRFASKYNFNIDEGTYKSIRSSAYRIRLIVKERVESELNKILTSNNPIRGISLLNDTGIIHYYMCAGVTQDMFDVPRYREPSDVETRLSASYRCLRNLELGLCDLKIGKLKGKTKEYATRCVWMRFITSLTPYVSNNYDSYSCELTYDEYEFVAKKIGHSTITELKTEWNILKWFTRINERVNSPMKINDVRQMAFEMGEDAIEIVKSITIIHGQASPFRINEIIKTIKSLEPDGILKGKLDISGEDIQEVTHLKPSRLYAYVKEMATQEVLAGKIKNTPEDIKKYLKTLLV